MGDEGRGGRCAGGGWGGLEVQRALCKTLIAEVGREKPQKVLQSPAGTKDELESLRSAALQPPCPPPLLAGWPTLAPQPLNQVDQPLTLTHKRHHDPYLIFPATKAPNTGDGGGGEVDMLSMFHPETLVCSSLLLWSVEQLNC